ncbi:MAG TPA: GDP-mannose 4,6-dehydratase [Candidatus Omnitrophota bacterium]|nr:GDP-mannose 4,6-dehydratase [Candidatus Omnitrophota bacterium]HPD84749.1 GDP-mannose 4,6-dehydratase [Candidatus Omnitrophota bacterium]HRZ03607.1 GDP-mannose 4,6-dehydratase [Candidatus Omnitrophota bacterium]
MEIPTILIVDDEPDLLKLVTARLEGSGFKVRAFTSGQEALHCAFEDAPGLVILDILMPGMDGYEVLQKLRSNKNTVDVPIIMLSAKFSQEEKTRALDSGADDYITKPYEPKEFISRINALLRRSDRQKDVKSVKNVLITGGAGFIGSHLTRALLAKNYNVFILDDFSTGREENIQDVKDNPNLHLIRGSITDEAILSKLVEQCDLIYHLAATVGVKNVVEKPLDTIIYDTLGTVLVLKYASGKGIKVVMTSTSEVYGKSVAIPFSESTDLIIGPPDINRWSYACSKLLDEFLTVSYYRERGLPAVVVRLFNVVGPGQMGRYGMVIPRFFKNALTGKPIVVYGDGEQVRCFTDVDDVVEILMELSGLEKANGEVINLGSDREISIKDLALKIKEITKSASPIVFEPYSNYYGHNFQDIRKRVPNLTKLKKILGRTPQTGLDVILEKVKDYFVSHPQELEDV